MWEYLLTLLITIWLLQLKAWPHLGIWGHLTVLYASKDAALGELIGSCVLSYEAKVQMVWVAPAPPPSSRNREHYYLLSCAIKIHYSASWHIISDLLQYKRSIFSLNLGGKKRNQGSERLSFQESEVFLIHSAASLNLSFLDFLSLELTDSLAKLIPCSFMEDRFSDYYKQCVILVSEWGDFFKGGLLKSSWMRHRGACLIHRGACLVLFQNWWRNSHRHWGHQV